MTIFSRNRRTIGLAVALGIFTAFLWVWSPGENDPADRTPPQSDLDPKIQEQDQITTGNGSRTSRPTLRLPTRNQEPAGNSGSNGSVRELPLSVSGDRTVESLEGTIDPGGSVELSGGTPDEIQHFGEYMDPDNYTAISLPDENPDEIRHLGEFIDPDDDPLTDSEN